ncbi:MAG TPA: type II toxin-antitoxin system RelE/ParE family toxin [Pyrinomonadaceae bacterium]|nr:type II toxin-antitoxin system RelE/ParE family toxin [Pyrinomonadaceae bacterium]
MASYSFHSEAADEYLAAARYYLEHASLLVAAAFVAEIEAAIQILLKSPAIWPVIEEPQIRRYLLRKFPYSLYYRWEPEQEIVSIYAVMHFSQLPGYWRHRS